MQRYIRFVPLAVCSALFLAGCAGSGPAAVARIGNTPLTLEEFEDSYAKNNGGWEKATTSSYEDREKFLDLLVKFRLKVQQANDRGLMTDSTIKAELEGYEVTVATSFMLEKEIVAPKTRQLYDRKKEELRASHILIRLNPDAPPADTLAAYNKATMVIGLIPTSVFDSLATTYSDDQSAALNHGDLGYFTSGKMVPDFEDACFGLKVGEYTTSPVRTQFGYHIIKLTGRQANKGAVRVSHILRRFKDTPEDSTVVKDSVKAIYTLVKGGLDFAEAARRYTEDAGSQVNSGDIGYYDRGRIPPAIENLFFNTPVDSVIPPYQMPYGYHIFKITGFKSIPPFAEMEKELRDQYNQMRYQTDYQRFVRGLARQYKLTFDTLAIVQLMSAFDSTQTPASWTWSDTLTPAMRKKVLLTCEGRPATVGDFVEHLNNSAEFKSMLLTPKNVQHMMERLSEVKMMEEHARQVPQRYPAFSKLLKEYQDGILLYRIEQDEVWKKVVVNDSLLRVYYDQHKEKYLWPNRVNFAEIFTTTDSLVKAAYNEIKMGKDFSEVAEKYTMRSGYKEKKGVWGLTPDSVNIFSRYAALLPVDSISRPFDHPDGWSIIKVTAKEPARIKTFEEAMPEVMSAYQEYASKLRQEEWVADLKSRYPVTFNKPLLLEAFKRKPVAAQ
ncbi:MAG: peptidylprolyl isomerase [Ignavibacteriales bacterium]|nr:peptidylprolyl isomerase [Ignavibacteriales bacterium]